MKNKFIKSTLILIISGLATKVLGMITRILYTQAIGDEGVSIYSLVMPTYSLLLTFAILSMPFAISKCVAERKRRARGILSSALAIMLLVNILVIGAMLFSSKFIAGSLLKDVRLTYLLIICSLTLPFISISSVIKGYFFGKQNMLPNAISNIIEQIIRIILILYILPIFVNKGLITGIKFLIVINIITEITSIVVLSLFLPKKKWLDLTKLKPNLDTSKELMTISIPSVFGRLVGNIGYFFEPILLTNILLAGGFSRSEITMQYGFYNAYSVSLLLMPSFFINAIAQSLLPEITQFYSQKNMTMVKRRLRQGIIFALVIGFGCSMGIWFFRQELLQLLYHTSNGEDYIRVLAPFFVLFYLEAPLSSVLVAIDKVKLSTEISIWGVLVKLAAMCILAFKRYGVMALCYAEIINIIFIVVLDFIMIKKYLNEC